MRLNELDVLRLESALKRYPSLSHLRVKKHGDALLLLSGKAREEQKHARLTALGKNVWGLSLPRHTGRWERTPFIGPLDQVLDTLITGFGFYLSP
jgi:hypothetical protein